MTKSFRFVWLMMAVLACVFNAPVAGAQEKELAAKKPLCVLFVGNSQIFYNDLPRLIETLSESAPAGQPRISADRAVAGGASLESLWNRGEGKGTAREKITSEKWDFVVLQEIYNVKPDSFTKHARLLDELIRKNGSKTVLLSTASISTLYPKGFQDLHEMHVALGKELKVPVAAAGKAWLSYWGDSASPEQRLGLYDPDKAHPGKKGSYIYACTLYPILTGHSPVGLTHRLPKQPEETLSPAEAKQFQEAAWRVHQEINGK
ncbi:SGNH/GDSL hydrolase family protein [Zavarzinella formosa]|uniref:SGNH/GDSL hydrolase family protein n=1 Tax=Zavarzinella formosa TaxID=360055 RepID=UPI0003034C5F|nr:SGNH/GDSL hydrolase family protein [Zavarzinella formosa]